MTDININVGTDLAFDSILAGDVFISKAGLKPQAFLKLKTEVKKTEGGDASFNAVTLSGEPVWFSPIARVIPTRTIIEVNPQI